GFDDLEHVQGMIDIDEGLNACSQALGDDGSAFFPHVAAGVFGVANGFFFTFERGHVYTEWCPVVTNQMHIAFRSPNGDGRFVLAVATVTVRIEVIEAALYV